MREVRLGNASRDTYAILEGLKNGDEVVTNGTFTVDAAAQLQDKKYDEHSWWQDNGRPRRAFGNATEQFWR